MSKDRLARRALAVTGSTLLLMTGSAATAQTWNGSASSDMLDDANWAGGTQPGVGGNAIIAGPAAHMPVIDGTSATLSSLFAGYDQGLDGVTLELINGGSLNTNSTSIGEASVNNAGGLLELQSATATLSGASSFETSFLNIGSYGTGVVNVTDASTISATANIVLGQHRSDTTLRFGTGTMSITGAGSHVTANALISGATGVGVVNVLAGGKLTTGASTLGQNALGEGTITVSGTGSRWDVSSAVTTTIGDNGTGTVNITNGGVFSSPGMVVLGSTLGTGRLTVSGSGSQLNAGQIRIGGNGSGIDGSGEMVVSSGAIVEATHLLLGNTATGIGTMTVTGANTAVSASTYAMVGWEGKGTLTLSEAAALTTPLVLVGFSGGSEGTLNIGAASGIAALAPGALDTAEIRFGSGSGTVAFNHTGADFELGARFTGTGTIRHIAGTTSLTGNSSTFSGNTVIDGGTLKVMQNLAGSITINSGGTLGGAATVGSTQVNSGGTLAPGGTLAVDGNLAFADSAIYQVQVANGTSTLVTASGSANLDGTVKVQPGANVGRSENHRILSAATLAGTFDGITSTSAFIDAALNYTTPNEVWISLQRNDVSFEDIANSPNQKSIGQVFTNLPADNPLVAALSTLSAEAARQAMDEFSGDTHSTLAATGMSVSGQAQGVVMNRIRQSFSTLGSGSGMVSSYLPGSYPGDAEPARSPVSFWLQGLGEYGHVRPTTTAGGLDTGTGGILGGVDTLLDDWRVGVTAGYTGTRFDAVGRNASGTVNNLHAGIYAGADLDPVRLQFNALQTWHGISSRRDLDVGGFTDTLTASYGSATSLVFGEAGYAFDLGAVELEPFGSLSYAMSNTGAYTETGGSAALTSSATQNHALTSVIGARAETSMAMGDKLVTFNGMLGWQHHSGQAPTTQFTLPGSQAFTVTGANPAIDALVYEAGINLDFSETVNMDLLYSGRVAPGDVSHGIRGVIAASF